MEDIGQILRSLREERGLSLRKLAEETGFSPSFLSRLENGKSSITIQNLIKLLNYFGTTLPEIFASPFLKKIVYRRGERKVMRSSEGVTLELFIDDRTAMMEPIMATFGPRAHYKEAIEHGGEEFALVLKGECRFEIDGVSFIIREGDCVNFPGDKPHSWENISSGESRVLMVITPPGV